MNPFLKYWHTIKYLKPVQLYGRLFFMLNFPRPDLRPPPPLRRPSRAYWTSPIHRKPSFLPPKTFSFLNETHSLDEIGWDNPNILKLWKYNLHYFDYLNTKNSTQNQPALYRLMLNWINKNPPGTGTGWEPYPVSLRIVNWIKWALNGNHLSKEMLHSLAVQVRWLTRRLEFHLLGNHLIANAKALIYAGFFFQGNEADYWLKRGIKIMLDQMPEQILDDGAHFELSTMYQGIIIEDFLDLINLANTYNDNSRITLDVNHMQNRVIKMLTWLGSMCHPDGKIGFFNDAAFGIAPAYHDLISYANRCKIESSQKNTKITNNKNSGYIRLERNGAVLLIDVARIGPDYLPAHAHADTLAFEFSLGKQRIFVNSGTSCYHLCRERIYQRSTAAHNTVQIDKQDSSEVWGSFRVARRAKPFDLKIDDNNFFVTCSHDGYKRLPSKAIHKRSWILKRGNLIIIDCIEGAFNDAEAKFFLHPAIQISSLNLDNTALSLDILNRKCSLQIEGGVIDVIKSYWFPEFGKRVQNSAICIKFKGPKIKTSLSWDI